MPSRSSTVKKPQRCSSKPEEKSLRLDPAPLVAQRIYKAQSPVEVSVRSWPLVPASLRHDMIRDAAYLRSEARGFVPGKEIEDWLAAEQDVDELILRRYGG